MSRGNISVVAAVQSCSLFDFVFSFWLVLLSVHLSEGRATAASTTKEQVVAAAAAHVTNFTILLTRASHPIRRRVLPSDHAGGRNDDAGSSSHLHRGDAATAARTNHRGNHRNQPTASRSTAVVVRGCVVDPTTKKQEVSYMLSFRRRTD